MFDTYRTHLPSRLSPTRPRHAGIPLPPTFGLDTAAAAYRVEGAAYENGKSAAIWDAFSNVAPPCTKGGNGDAAGGSYYRTSEDVDLMASYGVDVYHFSIS